MKTAFIYLCILLSFSNLSFGQGWTVKPLTNNVFVKEKGQFKEFLSSINININEPIICGVENAEFNAYFTNKGVYFIFPEYKKIKKEGSKDEEEKQHTHKTIWHKIAFKWKANNLNDIQAIFQEKTQSYQSYEAINKKNINKFNFINEYKKLVLKNIFTGCDILFSFPKQGGIKYQLVLHNNASISSLRFYWENIKSLKTDNDGRITINTDIPKGFKKNNFWRLTDNKPTAYTANNHTIINIKEHINKNEIFLALPSNLDTKKGDIIIDPWIQNPNFPDLNRAYDIQTDAVGNVIILGNYSQGATKKYHIQKYSPTGALLWTYTYYSKFLGDIAVDNSGNIYHVGQYPTGRRTKLTPNATQLWTITGLTEEWRLAFNQDKTILSLGGNFGLPANLAQLNLSTGALSNQMSYSEETRAITTDCFGTIYALTIPSASSTCNLRKINNFTLVNTVPSGFPVNYSGVGYAFNPDYSVNIFQGFNGIIINGNDVDIYNGATLRKFNKNTLAFITTTSPPNSSYLHCSGLAADYCGNLYVGTMTGIAVYDSSFNYISTISTPGAVYDILLANDGSLLACGETFVENLSTTCPLPAPLVVNTSRIDCEHGAISTSVSGGNGPYTYNWLPGGQTTPSISNLSTGTYHLIVADKFCKKVADSIIINPSPLANFTVPSGCFYNAFTPVNTSTISLGTVIGENWNFGDGDTSSLFNPTHTYLSDGLYNVTLIAVSDSGCTDTITQVTERYPKPLANFININACFGDSNCFVANSTINPSDTITSFTWNFGDASPTSSNQNVCHVYPSSGSFNVNLSVASNHSCIDDTIMAVTVFQLPTPNFSATTVCENTPPTQFTDMSIGNAGNISAWHWNFGDGGTSNIQNPNYTYLGGAGTYNVQLIATSDSGCVDSISLPIIINPKPAASFTYTNDCFYNSFNPVNTSTISLGTVIGANWNFGNGDTSNMLSPTYTYTTDGLYNVTLIAVSDSGCTDTITQTIERYPKPIANFSGINVCMGDSNCFINNTSINPSDTLASYIWNFGDGTPLLTTTNLCHLYATYGTYNVTLIATSNHNCVGDSTKQITVYQLPVANFTADSICENTPPTHFTDLSVGNSANINLWNWNFGLGFSSTQNPTFNFNSVGTYTITLTVANLFGCKDSITNNITVKAKPNANFTVDTINGCIPLCVNFQDLSSANANNLISWQWNLANNTSIGQTPPQNCYDVDGSYDISLIVQNNLGCYDTLQKPNYITAYPLPTADFIYNPASTDIYAPKINFENTSFGSTIWNWSFGDGDSSSTFFSPTHQYADSGNYLVHLDVWNQYGCYDSTQKILRINPVYTLWIPNTFTPDGDNVNDFFFAQGYGIKELETLVFDRWGNIIFSGHQLNSKWDGTYQNKLVQTGTYVYKITAKDVFDTRHKYVGRVAVLK